MDKIGNQTNPNWCINFYEKLKEIYDNSPINNWTNNMENFLSQEIPSVYQKLPWLNNKSEKLSSGQVVCFRGMIQDMFDPELYLESYVIKTPDGCEQQKPGKYLDSLSCQTDEIIDFESQNCKTKDRNSYLCISIPGESEWVKEQVYGNHIDNSGCGQSKKRLHDDEINMIEDCEESETKKAKACDGEAVSSSKPSGDVASPFPFAEAKRDGIACIIKLYTDINDLSLRLNDVIEVVGVLSPNADVPLGEEMELVTRNKSNELPSLHAFCVKKMAHCNPLIGSEADASPFCSSETRAKLGAVLDAALLGDEMTAEYVLCHLVSSVHSRQDVLPIGKFSLNVSGITAELRDKGFTKIIFNLIRRFTTHSHFLPMTLNNMNTMDFVPKKDYETECLAGGLLQLPSGFHLVVDETQLDSGQLSAKGVANATALASLIRWQKVQYNFKFHQIEHLTDVPVLVLSEGKAMMACDYHVRLQPKHTDVASALSAFTALLDETTLEAVRKHVTLARIAPYKLSQKMQQMIEEDFVESRQRDESVSGDDLHHLLTLARLLSLSCGKAGLDANMWRGAKELERERRARVTNL